MKKNIKTIFKTFVAAIAVVFGISLFAVNNVEAKSLAYTQSELPFTLFSQNHSEQNVELKVNELPKNNSSVTFDLLENSDATFSVYYSTELYTSVTKDVIYTVENKSLEYKITNPTQASKFNGQIFSVVELSNNIMLALQNGAISVSSTSKAHSTSYSVVDTIDQVTSKLIMFNSNDTSLNQEQSNTVQTDNEANGVNNFAYSGSDLKTKSYNRVSVYFSSELKGLGRYGVMFIKQPQITISSNDANAPEIAEITPHAANDWVQSRTVPVTFADAGSGIYKIEWKKPGDENWTEVCNFADTDAPELKTSVTKEFNISENGTYKFRAVDNVGNVSEEITYEETCIDTVKPSATVTMEQSFGVKEIQFVTDIVASTLSKDTFTYVLKDAASNTVATGEIVDRITTVEVDTDGNYTLEVYGIDVAQNEFKLEPALSTKVERTRVTISIEDVYEYSKNGLTLSISESVQGDYTTSWTYFNSDCSKELTEAELKSANVGTYVVKYSIDAYAFVGEGAQEITIQKRKVYLSSVKKSYYYGDTAFEYTLYDQQDSAANIIVTFTNAAGDAADFVNVGTYNYTILAQNANYEVVSSAEITCSGEAVINKFVVVATINPATRTAVYSKTAKFLEVSLNADLDFVCEYTLAGQKIDNPINVGEYVVTITLAEENANYYFEPVETMLTITKKDAYVIIDQQQSKLYGQSDEGIVFGYTTSGIIAGDETAITGALAREAGENVGYYNITLGTLDADNYNLQLYSNEVFEILPLTIILMAQDAEKVYGEADPVFTYNKLLAGSGILESDKAAFDANNIIVRKNLSENVGRYEIGFNPELKSVAPFKNYTILSATANFEIKKANLTITAHQTVAAYDASITDLTYCNELNYTLSGLKFDDELDIVLVRQPGLEVGEYEILLNSGNFENYNIEYVSAIYKIVPRNIKVIAQNVTKTYGDGETLLAIIKDASTGEEIENNNIITLSRIAGEGVIAGGYEINAYELFNNNYNVAEFVYGVLVIEKAPLSVSVNDAEKVYGEADPKFTAELSGLKFNDKINVLLTRQLGENAGTYEILLDSNVLENYNILVSKIGQFVIHKATPIIEILGAKYVYNGEAISYLADSEFELEYKFFRSGEQCETPVDAGNYSVIGYFAGNENYNATSTNEARIEVSKKFIPITLKKLTFLYNGKGQIPEYEIGLDENVAVVAVFEQGKTPVEVGEYKFSIVSNEPNYYSSVEGVLKIVEVMYVEDNSSSASISSTAVSATNTSVQMVNNVNSSLMKMFNPLFDGRKCMAVYEFSNAGAKTNGEVFTVRIKTIDTDSPVEIYTVSSNGELVKSSYIIEDGYYVLSLNTLSARIMVTTTNNMMFYARIIAIVAVLVLTVFITKVANRHRRNNFLKRNTSFTKFSEENLRENIGIVNDRVDVADRISGDSFARIKKPKAKVNR